jgi:hypothetical protein
MRSCFANCANSFTLFSLLHPPRNLEIGISPNLITSQPGNMGSMIQFRPSVWFLSSPDLKPSSAYVRASWIRELVSLIHLRWKMAPRHSRARARGNFERMRSKLLVPGFALCFCSSPEPNPIFITIYHHWFSCARRSLNVSVGL